MTVWACIYMALVLIRREMTAEMQGGKGGKEVEELDPASSARHSKEGTKAQRWIDASSVQSRSNVPRSLDLGRSQFEEVGTRAQGQMTPSVQEPVFNYVHGSGLLQFMMLRSFTYPYHPSACSRQVSI